MLFPLQNIPTLATDRLTLDGFSPEDHQAFSAMLADPRVGAPKGFPQGATPEQAWAGIANILGHWALRGFGLFVVRLKESGEFLGSVGLIASEGWPSPEATWTIAYPHQGKGYAKEAAAVVRDYAMKELRLEKIVSFVPPDNEPSKRVAAAIGMKCSGTVRVFGELAVAWELAQ
jgi:[ribosomal protein S5]-alanine N-acetyltransferase